MANILAISGGGVRGILAATLIKRMDHETKFLDKVDLVAGTSTGAIIAAAIAANQLNLDEIIAYYREAAAAIFTLRIRDRLRSLFGLYRSKYDGEALRKMMREIFGDLKMRDLKRPILIPAIDLGGRNRGFRAKFFDNFRGSFDLDIPVSEVVIASCSGPTYFPAHPINLGNVGIRHFADGGVICNHPAVAAICAAMDRRGLAARLDEINCLAVTTGNVIKDAEGWRHRGVVGWIDDIVDVLMEQYSTVVYEADQLLQGEKGEESRFMVVNPNLEIEMHLDEYKRMAELEAFAETVPIEFACEWIQRQFLKKHRSSA